MTMNLRLNPDKSYVKFFENAHDKFKRLNCKPGLCFAFLARRSFPLFTFPVLTLVNQRKLCYAYAKIVSFSKRTPLWVCSLSVIFSLSFASFCKHLVKSKATFKLAWKKYNTNRTDTDDWKRNAIQNHISLWFHGDFNQKNLCAVLIYSFVL